jgi:hypothetical protein
MFMADRVGLETTQLSPNDLSTTRDRLQHAFDHRTPTRDLRTFSGFSLKLTVRARGALLNRAST